MHVTWLIGVATLLAQKRNAWRRMLMPVFQPAEETGVGAQAMIDDGLFKPFRSRAPYWGSTSWSELPATFADFTGTMKGPMTMPDRTVIQHGQELSH